MVVLLFCGLGGLGGLGGFVRSPEVSVVDEYGTFSRVVPSLLRVKPSRCMRFFGAGVVVSTDCVEVGTRVIPYRYSELVHF